MRWFAVVLLLWGASASAQGFFLSSARRWISEADSLMERGRQAEEQQRVMDACDAYSQAHELYRKAQMESPNTRADHVARQDAESRARLRTLFARAAAGQVPTPLPEEVMPMLDAPRPGRRMPADEETDSDLLDPQPPAVPRNAPSAPQAASEAAERRTWLDRIVPARARAHGRVPRRQAQPEEAKRPAFVAVPESSPSFRHASAPASGRQSEPDALSDNELSRKIQAMLDEGSGAEAVMLMEGILEQQGASASLTRQLLFVQALMNRRNYNRAEGLLTSLLAAHPENPSVRMMTAGLHLAKGRPMAALRLLDELVREYPRYADAYINLAYIRFAMDPAANRDEAIVYYRHALTLGARRDPRLELELRVDIDL